MLGGALVGLALPLLPAQILWINLFTHGFVGVAFGSEPSSPDEMARPPRPPSEPIFPRPALLRLLGLTAALTAVSLVVGAVVQGDEQVRRTAIFLTLGAGQLGVALALRAPRAVRSGPAGHILDIAVPAAGLLLIAAIYATPLQALLGTRPLPGDVVVLSLVTAALPGLALLVARRRRSP